MNEEEARRFAILTTAEVEVLRGAVAMLVAQLLAGHPKDAQEEYLASFQSAMSEMHAAYGAANADQTGFYEAVAEEVPLRAASFVRAVRRAIES